MNFKPLDVNVDGERVTIQVQQKDDLISVAHMLREMGHDMDVEYPHIRVAGHWVSEREALDTNKYYHFCKLLLFCSK